MAKAKTKAAARGAAKGAKRPAAKPGRTAAGSTSRGAKVTRPARSKPRRATTAAAAMPRSMQNRGGGESRKAVQAPRQRTVTRRDALTDEVTRVTQETEVRGSTTRIERVVERA